VQSLFNGSPMVWDGKESFSLISTGAVLWLRPTIIKFILSIDIWELIIPFLNAFILIYLNTACAPHEKSFIIAKEPTRIKKAMMEKIAAFLPRQPTVSLP